jgi:putative FmdB family regulatory protein
MGVSGRRRYTAAMPIYEFECKQCHTTFEKLLKRMDEKAKEPCPACGSKQTARKLSVFAATTSTGGKSEAPPAQGCGRCGGPEPCAFD